ncbi:Fe-S oxidoreductase [Paramagnetospirillum magnetotacticum MS-1]|uniref:Fe-S oxidoreductase n=1 Tax=Paramagnetospirillum magnetotacticum MS-1 TaxID=272627 RepID=A0A0C2YIK9_PARME|nr:Fe-S oxidoreductase [Paramagnetospirillum magnetotacticum MS-1]
MIPAYAATRLKNDGYAVLWDDAIAEELSFEQWWERILSERPDVIAMEVKTPTVRRHWAITEKLKRESGFDPIVVLFGDHVTALPAESFEHSPVDYVVTGGDFDFVFAGLIAWLDGKSETLPGGVWRRLDGRVEAVGAIALHHDLDTAPIIDRDLTRWELYAYRNGNFKYTPGTYVMAGRDCWWGRCSFCSWTTIFPGATFRTVSPQRALDEIGQLIERGIKEIFDDSGCFPKGEWLREFCDGLIARGYHKRVVMGCNMRVGALSREEWQLLGKANFRFVLIGLESVTQSTLDRLKKGIRVSDIEATVRLAKEAGLEPHVTTMVGYPWETALEAENTIAFARQLFKSNLIDSLQATIVVPYPGTVLFAEAREQGWLLTEDWDRYDMKESVWNSPISSEDVLRFTQELYKAALSPRFVLRKLAAVRSVDDVRFLMRAGVKLVGHLVDFRGSFARHRSEPQ